MASRKEFRRRFFFLKRKRAKQTVIASFTRKMAREKVKEGVAREDGEKPKRKWKWGYPEVGKKGSESGNGLESFFLHS